MWSMPTSLPPPSPKANATPDQRKVRCPVRIQVLCTGLDRKPGLESVDALADSPPPEEKVRRTRNMYFPISSSACLCAHRLDLDRSGTRVRTELSKTLA